MTPPRAFDEDAALRQAFGPGFDRHSSDAQRVRALRDGRLQLAPHPETELPAEPTWLEDPFAQNNWKFQFHALRWLDPLRRQAAAGDADAMALWERYARSWVEHNPPGAGVSSWAWVDMGDGLRAQAFSYALPYLDDPSWVLSSLEEHGEWLADESHIHHGNHAMVQHVGLFVVGCVLRSARWRDLAVGRLAGHLASSYDDQGVNEEASIAYQLLNYRWWRAIERRLALEGLPRMQAADRLDRAPDFLAHATAPDGRFERIGDTDVASADGLGAAVTDYVTSGGANGVPPDALTAVYRAGYVFGRSGWGETDRALADETFYSVRFGRQDAIHGHPDGGGVTYAARGVRWLTDTGKYAYDSSAMRRYVLGRAGQSSVEVVGVPYDKSTVVELVAERHDARFDSYTTRDRGYAGHVVERVVTYSRRGEWIMLDDRVTGPGQLTARVHLHLGEGVRVAAQGRSLALAHESGARAGLMFAGSRPDVLVLDGSEDPFGGWLSTGWRQMVAAPEVVLSRSGTSARFLTVLTPASVAADEYLRAAAGATRDRIELSVPTATGEEVVRLERGKVVAADDDPAALTSGPENQRTATEVRDDDATSARLSEAAWAAAPRPEALAGLHAQVRAMAGATRSDGAVRAFAEDLLASADGSFVGGRRLPGLHRPGLPRFRRSGSAPDGPGGPAVPVQVCRADEPLALDDAPAQHLVVDLGRLALPMRLASQPSRTLVVAFHGALDRARTTLPRYERVRSLEGLGVSTLVVADPTLDLADDLTLGWYLGTATTDVHAVLAARVAELGQVLGADRVLLTGSSGGGFAALQVASRLPAADVLVFNPQIDVRRYYARLAQRALVAVFGVDHDAAAAEVAERVSVVDRSASSTSRLRVTYVQNVNDRHHVDQHFARYLDVPGTTPGHVELDVREVAWEQGHAGTTAERFLEHLVPLLGEGA